MIEAQGAFPGEYNEDQPVEYKKIGINDPSWKSVMVTRHLPDAISGLETLSKNLWWCWNESAKSLFKSIDPEIWDETKHNPMALLDVVSLKKFKALAKDEEFVGRLNAVMDEFNDYMALKSQRTDPMVAYFCMEYGLDTSLRIYSGGLGLLAGDYLKETSDMNVNLVAVGLLYRYGYFTQVITGNGMHTGIRWLQDAFNDYYKAICTPGVRISEQSDVAHRKILAQRVAIDCIHALSKEQLERLDKVLDSIVNDIRQKNDLRR